MNAGEDTRDIDRSQLMYEHHRLDCEFDIVQCLGEELKKHGRYVSAEYIDEAKQHLMQAVFSIKNALKWADTVAHHEQIKMDVSE